MNEQQFASSATSVAAEAATHDPWFASSATSVAAEAATHDPWQGVPVTHVSSVNSSFERSYPYASHPVDSGDDVHSVECPGDVDSCDEDDPPDHLELSSFRNEFFSADTHLWLLNFSDFRDLSQIATENERSNESSSTPRPDCAFYCGSPVNRVAGMASLRAKAFQGDPEGWCVDLDDDTKVVRCYLSSADAVECRSQSAACESLSAMISVPPPTQHRAILGDSSQNNEDPQLPELGRRLFFVGKPAWTKAGFVVVLESLRALDDLNEESLFRGAQAEVYRDVYLPLKRRWYRRLAILQLRKLHEYADAVSVTTTRAHVKMALEAFLQGGQE